MNELTQATQPSAVSVFDANNMQTLMSFADIMAQGTVATPAHLRGKIADCLAISMQAMQWGMNPFAVASKTHVVNGVMGYESQLINAVISSSRAIHGRFKYEQVGDWSKWQVGNKASEQGLGVKVGAVLHGEEAITWAETLWIAPVTTRNSPLWKTNPYQQLCYLALKYWARLYTPDVILGVYDKDELVPVVQQERDITPKTGMNALILEDAKPVNNDNRASNNATVNFTEIMLEIKKIASVEDYANVRERYAKESKDFSQDQKAQIISKMKASKFAKKEVANG
jgi:hypothetical protein